MARGSKSPPPAKQQAILRIPQAEARAKLEKQVESGRRLLAPPANALAPTASEADYQKWNDYNRELLKRIFTADDFATDYEWAEYVADPSYDGSTPWPYKAPPRIACLESIINRLELIEAPEPAGGSADRVRRAYEGLDLHPDIADAASELYLNGHFANAIEDAVKALNARVRMRSGVELDGTTLMEHVFGPKGPILRFNNLRDQVDLDEQKGFMMMFSGAVAGLRNPRAHRLVKDDPERALEFIAFVSLLAKLLDGAKKGPPPKP